jgi:hypothetical protein
MEQMGGSPVRKHEQMQMSAEDIIVETKLEIQQKLAQEHGEDMYSFIENHAKDFGDFVSNNSSILEKYREDPDGTLREVEKIIYH